jgi:hypothetical protein
MEAISFTSEPPGVQIDPATQSSNTDIHVTLDSALGPADVGTIHFKENVKSAAATRGDALRCGHLDSLPTQVHPAAELSKALPEIPSS